MLLNFSVENYKNFKDKQTIFFNVEKNREDKYLDKDKIDYNTFEKNNNRFLKTISIYGANGTGKSNIIKALYFVKEFIMRPPLSSMPNTLIASDDWLKSFKLDNHTIDNPSSFELEFIVDNKQYRYFFSCDNNKVFEEKLEILNNDTKKYNFIYKRNKTLKINDEELKKSVGNAVSQLRDNILFLSLIISLNIDFAIKIQEFFLNKIFIIPADMTSGNQTINILKSQNNNEKEKIINFFNSIDVNISNIEITPNNTIMFERKNNENNNIQFSFYEESLGTLKMFNLIGDILYIIKNGGMFFVDELDCRLHIKLFKHIIELFNKNDNGAQLIFTTHNTTILNNKYNLFRRDQIYIINREEGEKSCIYSLADVEGIQKKANYENLFLDNLVGGNPIIGGFNV